MKISADIYKLSSVIYALKNEHWDYLTALTTVIFLIIIFIYSIIFNGYHLISAAASSGNEISRLSRLHETINQGTSIPTSNDISRWPLFSTMPATSHSANNNFVLVGIEYSAKDPSQAKAIISNNSENGESEIYSIGDKLPQGAIVNSISQDQVTLLYNGTLQTLSLQWGKEKTHD